ncbi:hypothetical protein RCL1_005540 [Eukaryota sp. TZLM3-RCL]
MYTPIPNNVEAGFKYRGNFSSEEAYLRIGFIRKVYSILFLQIVTTAVVSAVMMISPDKTADFISRNIEVLYVCLFGSIVVLVFTLLFRKIYPINLMLLSVFTLMQSFLIGMACAFSETKAVLSAALATACVFCGLTVYVWTTTRDYTMLIGIAYSLLFSFIFVSLFGLIWRLPFEAILYSLVGVCIFSLYIVIDTHMITDVLPYDEYVYGAIQLYLDLLNLFLHLLKLFQK